MYVIHCMLICIVIGWRFCKGSITWQEQWEGKDEEGEDKKDRIHAHMYYQRKMLILPSSEVWQSDDWWFWWSRWKFLVAVGMQKTDQFLLSVGPNSTSDK